MQKGLIPSGSYLNPYLRADFYERARPRYVWQKNHSEEEIVCKSLLSFVQARSDLFPLAIELGCGTGRFTRLLTQVSRNLIATDPSASMVDYCRHLLQDISSCKFYQASAEKVVTSGAISKVDLVAAFWSLSYSLQSFFELTQEADGRIIQQVADEDAIKRIQLFLNGLFPENSNRVYLIIFFKEDSEEQRWVTEQWSRIAPFPGGSRDFTWLTLQNYLEQLSQRGHQVKIENIEGVLVCENEEHLVKVFFEHHLRGMIPSGTNRCELKTSLITTMRCFQSIKSGVFQVPSAFRFVQVEILK